jgi:hypothetical protein
LPRTAKPARPAEIHAQELLDNRFIMSPEHLARAVEMLRDNP